MSHLFNKCVKRMNKASSDISMPQAPLGKWDGLRGPSPLNTMKEEEFDQIIKRCMEEQRSGNYNVVVEEWLISMRDPDIQWAEEDKEYVKTRILQRVDDYENDPYFISLEVEEEDSEFLLPVGPPLYAAPGISLPRPEKKQSGFKWYYAAAAALVPLALGIGGYLWLNSGNDQINPDSNITELPAVTSITKKLLSDGTIVWLKGDSKLEYPEVFDQQERVVSLQGEAFFEVAKDPAHPFVVRIGDMTARVLGTSFNIDALENNIEVIVLTGKVAVSSTSNPNGIIVLPDEKAMYNATRKELTKSGRISEQERAGIIAHTEFDMNFDDTNFREVIKRVEKKFNIAVQVNVPGGFNENITADFTDRGLKETFEMISKALGLEYQITGNNAVMLRSVPKTELRK